MPSSQSLIIPAPSFIEYDTLKGFLLAHPSFLIVLIFPLTYQALHFQKDAAGSFFSPAPIHLTAFSLLFLSKVFQNWQNCNCKNTYSAQQLPKGAESERNWSAGTRYSKQNLPVPCVLSNYEVQEVAGFSWAIKRLKTAGTKKVFAKKHLRLALIMHCTYI